MKYPLRQSFSFSSIRIPCKGEKTEDTRRRKSFTEDMCMPARRNFFTQKPAQDGEDLTSESSHSSDSSYVLTEFTAVFDKAREDDHQSRLVLTNFIEKATREDLSTLKELLSSKESLQFLKLNDTCTVADYRRWQFKKANVIRNIQSTVADRRITTRLHCTLEVDLESNGSKVLVNLFREVKKDPDVLALNLKGVLSSEKADVLMPELIDLLSCDQRHWEKVVFAPTFDKESEVTLTITQWNYLMKRHERQLNHISEQRGVPLGVRLPF